MKMNGEGELKYSQDITTDIFDIIEISKSKFAISCHNDKKVKIIEVDISTSIFTIKDTIDCQRKPTALYKMNDDLLLVGLENKLEIINMMNKKVINSI